MQIKVKSLTSYQTSALKHVKDRIPEIVQDVTSSSVTLNGSAKDCLTAIQNVMNDILEADGDSSTHRSLKAVRNKLANAARTKAGTSDFVVILANGTNKAGEVPSVLNGTAVVKDEDRKAKAQVLQSAMPVEEEPTEKEEELPKKEEELPRPTPPTPKPDDARRANYEYMLRTAPNPSARKTWERQLAALTT